MRICYLSCEYPPDTGGGGIGTYVHTIAHALAALGQDITVVAAGPRGASDTQDGPVRVVRVPETTPAAQRWLRCWEWCNRARLIWRTQRLASPLDLQALCYGWRACGRLRRLHRERPFDLIESAEIGAQALRYAASPKAPLVVRLHTPTFLVAQLNRRRAGRLMEAAERWMTMAADAISSPSASLAEIVARQYEFRREDVTVIPNPCPPDVVTSAADRPAVARQPMVLFVGRIERRKGVELLARAVPMVKQAFPAARFVMAGASDYDGDGKPMQPKIEQLLSDAGVCDAVEFTGKINRDAVNDLYARCALVVMPSLWENFAYGVLEPMGRGIPVVASRVGGMPEIIEHDVSGLLVAPEDANALAIGILRVLKDRELASRLGEGARRRVEIFRADRVARQMLSFYESVRRDAPRVKPEAES